MWDPDHKILQHPPRSIRVHSVDFLFSERAWLSTTVNFVVHVLSQYPRKGKSSGSRSEKTGSKQAVRRSQQRKRVKKPIHGHRRIRSGRSLRRRPRRNSHIIKGAKSRMLRGPSQRVRPGHSKTPQCVDVAAVARLDAVTASVPRIVGWVALWPRTATDQAFAARQMHWVTAACADINHDLLGYTAILAASSR